MNIVILSPHRDDAALSLALAIKGWLVKGHRVTVLGVFTRSLTAPYSDVDTVHPNDLISYVSAMRRREDAEFHKLLPALNMVDMNLKDAPLRLRCTLDAAFTLAPHPEDTAVEKIHKALTKLKATRPIDALLLPLALGHHVDHVVVRNAALSFAAKHPFAFYEDMPDALQSAFGVDESVQVELASLRKSDLYVEAASPVFLGLGPDSEEAVKTKRQIVSVYASQIDEETIDAISRFTGQYAGGERVWTNAAWIAAFS